MTGFNDLFLRTTYIDLTNEVLNEFANSVVKIKVMSINEVDASAAAAPPAKGAKGAPAVVAAPAAEETLVELNVPLSSIVSIKNCSLHVLESFALLQSDQYWIKAASVHSTLAGKLSSLSMKITADNEMAQFVQGCRILKWENATLISPPAAWGLKSPDVIDPKAKVPPTAAELRSRYIENIPKLVATQGKLATFELSIAPDAASSSDEDSGVTELLGQLFPSLKLSNGSLAFNSATAALVPIEQDIRQDGSLWTGMIISS